MVFFVIQVLVLVKEASQTEKMWLEYERSVVSFNAEHNNEQQHSLNSLGAPPVYPASLSAAGIVLRWIQSYGERLPLTGQHVLLFFKALRDEFVLDRELEHPFQPSTKKMDKDFNFGRYLGVCQSILLQKVVHVKIFTWVLFALGVVVYYLFVLLVDCNPTVGRLSCLIDVIATLSFSSYSHYFPRFSHGHGLPSLGCYAFTIFTLNII
jgi:hypothetical protein